MKSSRNGLGAVLVLLSPLMLLPQCANSEAQNIGAASEPAGVVSEKLTEGADISTDEIVAYQMSSTFRDGGRRCGTPDLPIATRRLQAQKNLIANADCTQAETRIKPDYAPGDTFEIPVIVHVVSKTDGVGRIPEAYVRSQIDVLNEDFTALDGTLGAGGTNVKVRFKLVDKDPQGRPHPGFEYVTNDAFFNDPGPRNPNPMKQALHWDTKKYFNLYTNDASGGGTLGYATFPQDSNGTDGYLDGVVIVHTSFGRDAPAGGIYNKGRTATHEVGHYLGLFHTFQSGCSDATKPYLTGDLVSDTNPESAPTFNCPVGAQSCSGPAPIKNYMDYTQDTCMNQFSPEQANRIRCAMLNYRSTLFQVVGAPPGGNKAPVADFGQTSTGLAVAFLDRSTDPDGQVVSSQWSFGDGASSTEKNPTHSYAQAGTFAVSLTVTDDKGATNTRSSNVTVAAQGQPDAGTPPGPGELASGVAVTGLSGAQDDERRFTISITQATQGALVVALSGGTGDADLYIRFGAPPTPATYDFRPFKKTNAERVSIGAPRVGTYYVMVRGYRAFSGATLRATF
jgi:PKD repeat protein